tara:strand:+ start:12404 stop:14023 length:1620 start_codon:yes stop_codon:yes gene_type:complete
MKPQFDHKVLSSFYLWFDDRLTRYGEAVQTGINQQFYYSNLNVDIPSNQVAYYSPDRQLVANGENVPSGVYISGGSFGSSYSFVDQNGNDPTGLLIDFEKGRVVMKEGVGSSLAISGNFDRKTINSYITNETEEELLFNTDFLLADGDDETFLQSVTGLGAPNYTVPAAFLSYNSSINKPFAFGGMQDTKTNIRALIIVNDNFSLDGAMSLFRDSTETCVPLIDFGDFPFGEYFHIKSPPYTYSGLYQTKMDAGAPYAFIEKVGSSKMYDTAGAATTIPQNMRIGFIDFTLSTPRLPKQEIAPPTPTPAPTTTTTTTTAAPFSNTYSVNFDGSNQYGSAPANSAFNFNGDMTLSVWVKFTSIGLYDSLVAVRPGSTPMFNLLIGDSGGNKFLMYCGSDFLYSTTTPVADSWYHVMVTIQSGVVNGSKMYINGSLESSGTLTVTSETGPLELAGLKTAYDDNYLPGKLDEIALWQSALIAGQVTSVYNGGSPDDIESLSPAGWWRMGDDNGGEGSVITDQGTGANNITLYNTPTFSTDVA